MNYLITYEIEKAIINQLGYKTIIDNSKTSDYISFDVDGFSHSVRISDHDALTGRSSCSLVSVNVLEINVEEWGGKFEANLDYDCDGINDWDAEIGFDTKEEAEKHNLNAVISEVIYRIKNIYN